MLAIVWQAPWQEPHSSSPALRPRTGWPSSSVSRSGGWASSSCPQLVTRLDPAALALLAVGGLAYTAGAIVLNARRRPDPVPAVFGYHEVFHAPTIVAVACQYVAIAFFVIPSA